MQFRSNLFVLMTLSLILMWRAPVYAQQEKKQFPISLSVTNQSWAFPLKKVFRMNPFYPGGAIETAYYYKSKPKFDFYQTAQLGGFVNYSAGHGLYLNSNLGLRYTFNFGLSADFSAGLGYFRTFYVSETYSQNSVGNYEKSNKNGIGSISANFTFGLGYDFSKKTNKDLALFVRYQWIASTYYWSLITIRPNGLLHLGITFNPFRKNNH